MSTEAPSDTIYTTASETGFDVQLVEALADATGRSFTQIPPLYDSIDIDALTTLIEDGDNISVQFEHIGCTVEVESGSITITSD